MTKLYHPWQRLVAWVLMILVIAFWLWFGIGSAYVEQLGPVNWVIHLLVPGGIFLVSALVAWWWEGIGGVLLVLEGLFSSGFIGYAFFQRGMPPLTILLMSLTLALPPLVAGILFLFCWRKSLRPAAGFGGM